MLRLLIVWVSSPMPRTSNLLLDPESQRLLEDEQRKKNWKRWGPYLSERQWGTVREDYSPEGNCWEYFPHNHVGDGTGAISL